LVVTGTVDRTCVTASAPALPVISRVVCTPAAPAATLD
jgi:hypothetical protein